MILVAATDRTYVDLKWVFEWGLRALLEAAWDMGAEPYWGA